MRFKITTLQRSSEVENKPPKLTTLVAAKSVYKAVVEWIESYTKTVDTDSIPGRPNQKHKFTVSCLTISCEEDNVKTSCVVEIWQHD